jgi:hypothetical protein
MSKKLEFKMSADNYEDDADEGNHITKEEERERKKAVQARIRKEQAEGPPPDMSKRSVSRGGDMSHGCVHPSESVRSLIGLHALFCCSQSFS